MFSQGLFSSHCLLSRHNKKSNLFRGGKLPFSYLNPADIIVLEAKLAKITFENKKNCNIFICRLRTTSRVFVALRVESNGHVIHIRGPAIFLSSELEESSQLHGGLVVLVCINNFFTW